MKLNLDYKILKKVARKINLNADKIKTTDKLSTETVFYQCKKQIFA